MAGEPNSIVEYFSGHEGYSCGYCKGSNTNFSHGMWAHSLTVQDYQDLIDRGWRRSGKYCYKPTMNVTCCPHYTIKMEAGRFKMSKSHKKVIKTVNRYLIHGIKRGDGDKDDAGTKGANSSSDSKQTEASSTDTTKDRKEDNKLPQKSPRPGVGADPNRPPAKKAKEIRKERKLKKLEQMQIEPSSDTKSESASSSSKQSSNEPKTLEDLLNEPDKAETCSHKLEIRLVRSNPRSKEFQDSFKAAYKVYHKYQTIIHNDPPEKPSERQYTRFLVDSPLEEEHHSGGLPMGHGSFHQQYILDGKIIGVGVIDILPNCTSSVYLYYDPEYNFLSLGTYSALREIAFTRSLTAMDPEIKYYYMGYYIHSCPKMIYKGQYYPSYLLCPETYTWHPIENCRPKLDAKKYSRFADPKTEDENGKIELDNVKVLFMRQAMPYEIYKAFNSKAKDKDEVKEYAKFVGKKCAERMLLFRN